MKPYIHKVHYYETDRMGVTHHSNYIRFMEEARMDFMASHGYPLARLEAEGIASPVLSLSCTYKKPTSYDDEIAIEVSISHQTGATLTLEYVMRNAKTGILIATATSSHCFINTGGKPVAIKKVFPDFETVFKKR